MAGEAAPAYLAVARFNKPHGLRGEALVYPLTDQPDQVFVEGRALVALDAAGQPAGKTFTVERARRYHRQWLIKFRGFADRTELDQWPRQFLLGVSRADLTPPRNDQLYRHEITGVAVVAGGETIGVVRDLLTGPGGDLLEIEVAGRKQLVPFRKPIVRRVDRAAREIELDPPPGLLDL